MGTEYRICILIPGKEEVFEFDTIDDATDHIIEYALLPDDYELQEYVGWQSCKFGDDLRNIQDVIGR